jgi:hypothetical protein
MDRDDIHPVRLTNRQVEFLKHIIDQFIDWHEEEFGKLSETIKKAEEG